MKRKLEVTAKKVEDAIADGLKQLGMTIDEVDVKILSSGGFLKKAKIEMYYGEDIPDVREARKEPAAERAQKPLQPVKAPSAPAQAENSTKSQSKNGTPAPVAQSETTNCSAASAMENSAAAKPEKSAAKPASDKPPRTDADAKKPAEPHWGSAPQFKREPNMANDLAPATDLNSDEDARSDRPRGNNRRRGKSGGYRNANGADNNRVGVQKTGGDTNRHKERESSDPTPEQVACAVAFLETLMQKMGITAAVESKVENGLRLNLNTEDSRVIGYRGETLDALQYLVSLKLNDNAQQFVHVSLDGLDYRNKRKGILEGLANRMAEKCLKTGRKVSLEPMNSADRRVIHAVLGESETVITRSEGHEPTRHVVILPKKKPE